MANLKHLRNKIAAVKSIHKVAGAMKIVASVKLKKTESMTHVFRQYSDALSNVVRKIDGASLEEDSIFLHQNEVAQELVIVFAPSRGLCGSLNYQITKAAKKHIEELRKEQVCAHVIVMGRICYDSLKRFITGTEQLRKTEIEAKNPSYDDFIALTEEILDMYAAKLYRCVRVIYAHFHSIIKFEVSNHQLLPFIKEEGYESQKYDYLFEPSADKVLKFLIPYCIKMNLYKCFLESAASEYSSRMLAMDNATRNAESLISNLTTCYNRGRQSKITQELIEVISGAESVGE